MEMNNDNIIEKNTFEKPKLRESIFELTDKKKEENGFSVGESVIDIEQDGYAISNGENSLFTYGIEPCCGLVVYDEEKYMLFHLDGIVSYEEVLKIINKYNFNGNKNAVVIPGVTCNGPYCFNYKDLEEELEKIGFNIIEKRIPGTLGFIKIKDGIITIGTELDRSLDTNFMIDTNENKLNQELDLLDKKMENNNKTR